MSAEGKRIAAEWRKWRDSDEGSACLEGATSGLFLENRLWYAFMAGQTEGTAWSGGDGCGLKSLNGSGLIKPFLQAMINTINTTIPIRIFKGGYLVDVKYSAETEAQLAEIASAWSDYIRERVHAKFWMGVDWAYPDQSNVRQFANYNARSAT